MGISIIIVNYNNYNLTKKCIQSVIDQKLNIDHEIIVIDNDSKNNSYDILKESYLNNKEVKVIKNDSNIGFGGANNLAVKQSSFETLLFLNPDVVVLKNSIEKMYERIIKDEKVGVIGCKLLNEDGSLQHSCRRIMPFSQFIIARTPINKIIPKKIIESINHRYLMKDIDTSKEIYVDWVMGSCIMISKSLFTEIGGFSKEYFMYFEDVDLCYKVNKQNKKVLYYPDASMYHLHNQESVKTINKLTFIHLSSMLKFYKKFYFR